MYEEKHLYHNSAFIKALIRLHQLFGFLISPIKAIISIHSVYKPILIPFGNIPNFSLNPKNIYFTHFSSKIKYALSEYGIINIPNYEVSFLEITLTFAGFERG